MVEQLAGVMRPCLQAIAYMYVPVLEQSLDPDQVYHEHALITYVASSHSCRTALRRLGSRAVRVACMTGNSPR